MSEANTYIGRVVSVWAKDPAQGGVLENVHVRLLGPRAFVVGQLADDGRGAADARVGATFWFPVDEILMMTAYPDLEAARRAFAARDRQPDGSDPDRPRWRFWS